MPSTSGFISIIEQWPDYEVKMITDHMNHFPDPAKAVMDQRDRKGKVDAGIFKAQSELPQAIVNQLHQIDPMTRFRWDYDMECWAVDRAIERYGAWFPVIVWSGQFYGQDGLFEAMRKGDMQRFKDPAQVLKEKREAAKKKQKENEQAVNDKMRGVIDGLTDRQIDNMLAVENAMVTGEKVNVRGSDAATLNDWYDQTRERDGRIANAEHDIDTMTTRQKEALVGEFGERALEKIKEEQQKTTAINPGMKPHQYKRKTAEEYEKLQ